jgi:hypothetical protein
MRIIKQAEEGEIMYAPIIRYRNEYAFRILKKGLKRNERTA